MDRLSKELRFHGKSSWDDVKIILENDKGFQNLKMINYDANTGTSVPSGVKINFVDIFEDFCVELLEKLAEVKKKVKSFFKVSIFACYFLIPESKS